MGWLENRRLPKGVRLEIEDSLCPEEKAVIRLANGDINLDDLADEYDRRKETKAGKQERIT